MGSLSNVVDLTFPTVPNESSSLSHDSSSAVQPDVAVGNEEVDNSSSSGTTVDNRNQEEPVVLSIVAGDERGTEGTGVMNSTELPAPGESPPERAEGVLQARVDARGGLQQDHSGQTLSSGVTGAAIDTAGLLDTVL